MTSYRELVRNARAECFERHSGLSDEIFALAVNMNRVAYGVPDSRERTASPDEHGRAFSDLPEREQLDILGRLCDRSSYWRDVLQEALAESDRVPALIQAALDPTSTPAHLATFIREVLIGYAERVAALRGDELTAL